MVKLTSFFAALCCFFHLYAQIQEGGVPFAMQINANQRNIPSYQTADINLAALRQEDLVVDQYKDIPWRYGYIFYVDINILEEGDVLSLPNFDRITRYKVASNNAQTLNLTFNHYQLEPGAKLFIYSTDYKHIIGAFTSKNNKESGYLTTTLVEGSEIIIELYEPNVTIGKNQLNLERIVNGYRSLDYKKQTKGVGDSGTCNNNVICPEGDPWRDQIRAVGILLQQNNLNAGFCSGALLNNTCNDGKPYFLTANHCIAGAGTDPATVVVGFNFESTQCNNNTGPYLQNTISGTIERASNSGSDFCLLELSSIPPASYNVFYAGWDKSGNVPSNQTCIHHPAGDVKKITFDVQSANQAAYSGAQCWHIAAWDDGTTEPGSSGSPLFNQDKRIIGQLYGGSAECDDPNTPSNENVDDYFGRFDVSWDNGNNVSNELQSWLNPCGLNVNNIDGYDPNAIVLTYDASISFNNVPTTDFCGSKLAHSITIRNRGTEEITSLSLQYIINGLSNTYNWNGNLTSGQTTVIDFDSILVTTGTLDYTAYIINSSLPLDEDLLNDTIHFMQNLTVGIPVQINLTTNFAPAENTIQILDADSNVIETESNFSATNTYTFNYCLTPGNYCIKIIDAGDDGLSPTFWWDQGNYQLVVNGEEIINTDAIGSGYTYCLEYEPTGIKASRNVALNIFPNPSNGLVSIEANEIIKKLEVIDVLGKRIYVQETVNTNQMHINLSDKNKGVYFIVVETDQGKAIEKVILN